MGTKEGKNFNSSFVSVVAIKDGKIRQISNGYIARPKVNFGGGTVKWFDDRKLVKGGAVNG